MAQKGHGCTRWRQAVQQARWAGMVLTLWSGMQVVGLSAGWVSWSSLCTRVQGCCKGADVAWKAGRFDGSRWPLGYVASRVRCLRRVDQVAYAILCSSHIHFTSSLAPPRCNDDLHLPMIVDKQTVLTPPGAHCSVVSGTIAAGASESG